MSNRARFQGSAIYLHRSSARVANDLVMFNGTAGGDPHSVKIQDAAPTVVNDAIVRGDSRGASPATVMNNIIGLNGSSSSDGGRRGRGICDFSGGTARILWNDFFQNRVGALLTNGTDFPHVALAERIVGPPRPDAAYDDRDGSRNDMGFTGGPGAPRWLR